MGLKKACLIQKKNNYQINSKSRKESDLGKSSRGKLLGKIISVEKELRLVIEL